MPPTTTQMSATRRRYAALDPMWAGLDRECYIEADRHMIPVKRLSRRLGELSDIDRDGIGLN